ncbi:MAG TPA: Rieske 2Fe-2S domain-containing protein [Candidatus Nanopelagicaceae bacterium]|nr:Rieske 2Fe-2S domain-containing protein [Candidatus Nanopelagicaceae bacterium]
MSDLEPLSDPGLPAHVARRADRDPIAEKRAERQVAILFMLSGLSAVAFIASYVGIKSDQYIFLPLLGTTNAQQLALGISLALTLLTIGFGVVHWAKVLMSDHEITNQRHTMRSSETELAELATTFAAGAASSGLGRRSLIKRTLGGALALVTISPLIILRDLGPLPKKQLEGTNWKRGSRLITDPGGIALKASDLEVGGVAHVLPERPTGQKETLEDLTRDPVLVIRLRPEDLHLNAEQASWTHNGIIAFSKICTHMGCAVGLYEQQTHHLLCPCHQSTFDVTTGASVIFGPAARPLPQLAITVDSEGYLIAQHGFNQPVGPSFWERSS